MTDIFDVRGIKPMLIAGNQPPFDDPDYIYEIKFDGTRCIAYLDKDMTDLRNKRDKKLIPILPELSELHKHVHHKCVLDGELIVMVDGEPDFYAMQKRFLMTDPFKIKITAGKYPISFVAYDILYIDNKLITDKPLIERKKILEDTVAENDQLAVSRYIENEGVKLFQFTKERELEGMVAKLKISKYKPGKRTDVWIKCKHMDSSDCVICGYIQKENNIISLVLGQYDDNDILVYKGHVTMGVSLSSLINHGAKKADASPFMDMPKGNEDAVWLEPAMVCIVESMPTEKDSFRQPIFKGIRDDKEPLECRT